MTASVSAKDSLHYVIEQLSEEQCQYILELIQQLQQASPQAIEELLQDFTVSLAFKGSEASQVGQ
jgi:flagellar motor switch protein FliG